MPKVPISLFNKLLPDALLERLAIPYELDSNHSAKLSGALVFCTLLRGLLYDTDIALRSMVAQFYQFTGVTLHYSSLS